ncbi:Type IV pilus assembly ATPase PilB [Gammaproteobacteria bacterium]
MASPSPKVTLSGLGRRLVRDGLLTEALAQQNFDQAIREKTPFVSFLVQNKVVPARDIAVAASLEFGVPLLDLDSVDLDEKTTKMVGEKLVRQHHVLPLYKRGNCLFVAVTDPSNLQALDEIKFQVGAAVVEGTRVAVTEAVVVEQDKLAKAIERAMAAPTAALTGLDDVDLENVDIRGGEPEAGPDIADAEVDEAPIVRFVNKVLLDAINKKVSDIHIEPYEKVCRVRFRQDGILHEVPPQIPIALAGRLAARVKVMSKMDISERRIPQDGRIKMHLSKTKAIDFRVNSCPTLWGEKMVLRILDPSQAQLGIDALGYEPEQKRLFLKTIERPQGLVLVTGPTGSGKTVSLYTAVNILNTPDRNICTAEDPVEINLMGINQVHINAKVGLTFASALRAFLRQDPDVILVGEIRDLETAEIAIKAAQTGHMVLSTLHTNDAPQTLTRLANMGIPAYNIASSVNLIIAQRLARRLCSHCKRPVTIPREELLREGFREDELEGLTLFGPGGADGPEGPTGCEHCTNGYRGRVGIYQVMPVTEAMGWIIMEGGNAMQIAEQAKKEGIPDLRRSGLNKVRQGVTSLTDINRVTVD